MSNTQVISLRISNKNLAACLEFEELLTGVPSVQLTSSITLLIESSISLLTENKKLPKFSDFTAQEKINDFLRRTGKTKIGKREIFRTSMSLLTVPSDSEKGNRNKNFAPFTEEVPRESTTEQEQEPKEEIVCLERRKNEREILEEYEEEIEREVEGIQLEEELSLLNKIFMPLKKEKENGE